jgi:O-glycosyl hydrolase
LEPFNESTSNYWKYLGSQEGCHFTPETQMKIIRILHPKLVASGLKTVLSVSDETSVAAFIMVLKAYKSAGDILDKVGQLNTHTYSGTNAERAEAFNLVQTTGKPFWQSETGPGGGRKSNFEINLGLAQKLFDDLRIMKPQAWVDWQLMEEGNETWCLMKCNFNTQEYTIVKNLYVRMQITRFFKQGYTLVETGNNGVLAAINLKKTELIVSVINTSGKPELFNISCSELSRSGKKVFAYRTSTTENCIQISVPKIIKNSISYDAPSLSLTTFKLSI